MNEHEANQAAVESAEYWAGMEEDMFSSKDAYRGNGQENRSISQQPWQPYPVIRDDESTDAEHGHPRLRVPTASQLQGMLDAKRELKQGSVQILPDYSYPLRLHADDVALILRLEESNKKLLAKLEQVERLTGRLYDRT